MLLQIVLYIDVGSTSEDDFRDFGAGFDFIRLLAMIEHQDLE